MNDLMKKWEFVIAYQDLYVIPDEMKLNKESYEYKIISENEIGNNNKFVGANNKFYHYCKRGDCEWFSEWLKKPAKEGVRVGNNKINKTMLIKIIRAIDEMLSNMENYLVSENSLCLNLDSIATDGNNFYFTIIPNYNSDFSYELSKFLIRILRYIDVNDKEGMDLAYKLFVKGSQDNYTINDLLKICDEKEEK